MTNHPDTLYVRSNIILFEHEFGSDPDRGLTAFEELLADVLRALGPDHHLTLRTRHNVASWLGETFNKEGALVAFKELLVDCLRVLGPDDSTTLYTRRSVAFWLGETGDQDGAVNAYEELAADSLRVLGPDHPDTLYNSNMVTYWDSRRRATNTF